MYRNWTHNFSIISVMLSQHIKGVIRWFLFFYFFYFTPFSPQFRGIQLLVITILSHHYNSLMGSGETKVESHASSETQPNQATLLLNTARIQPGSQLHQCVGGNTVHLSTLVSVHCARPATGVVGARWDKDIPTGQTLPNPDDARPTWLFLQNHLNVLESKHYRT